MSGIFVFDEGNTRTKVGFFRAGEKDVAEQWVWPGRINDDMALGLPIKPGDLCIISTVFPDRILPQGFADANIYFAGSDAPWPFKIEYKTPETLGIDRLAAVAGAVMHFPNTDLLVVDAGTCITYEWLVNGTYLGGTISPGLRMRARAMHHFTGSLPEIDLEPDSPLIGASTRESLLSGIILAAEFEFSGFYHQFKSKYPQGRVVLTGGDAEWFEKLPECTIFAAPNLLLEGLAYTMRRWVN